MSIKEFKDDIEHRGIKQPLIILSDGTIVNGWRRYREAKRLGIDNVPVVVIDAKVQHWALSLLKDPYPEAKDEN